MPMGEPPAKVVAPEVPDLVAAASVLSITISLAARRTDDAGMRTKKNPASFLRPGFFEFGCGGPQPAFPASV